MKPKERAIIIALVALGFIVYKLNVFRSVSGIDSWFSDPLLITLSRIADVAFFGLFTGFIIAKILKNTK